MLVFPVAAGQSVPYLDCLRSAALCMPLSQSIVSMQHGCPTVKLLKTVKKKQKNKHFWVTFNKRNNRRVYPLFHSKQTSQVCSWERGLLQTLYASLRSNVICQKEQLRRKPTRFKVSRASKGIFNKAITFMSYSRG